MPDPFTQTVADTCGPGKTFEPKGFGVHRAIYEMRFCPICTGTWAAAGAQKRSGSFSSPMEDSAQREFKTIIEEYHAREK